MGLRDRAKAKAKAAVEKKLPKTVKTVRAVKKVGNGAKNVVNDAKSVVNGRCANCGTALRGGSCPRRGCWDLGTQVLSRLCFTSSRHLPKPGLVAG